MQAAGNNKIKKYIYTYFFDSCCEWDIKEFLQKKKLPFTFAKILWWGWGGVGL